MCMFCLLLFRSVFVIAVISALFISICVPLSFVPSQFQFCLGEFSWPLTSTEKLLRFNLMYGSHMVWHRDPPLPFWLLFVSAPLNFDLLYILTNSSSTHSGERENLVFLDCFTPQPSGSIQYKTEFLLFFFYFLTYFIKGVMCTESCVNAEL